MTKPRIPITSPAFKYVPAVETDLAATFRRIRREQKQEDERIAQEARAVVRPLRRQP